jgi:hypothetical protein
LEGSEAVRKKFLLFISLVGFSCVIVPSTASAYLLLTGESGDLSASVKFEVSGSDLIVTLTNTSTVDVMNPSMVLTAVFFTIEDISPLTAVSAVLGPGSNVLFGTTDPGGVVGGEWAYAGGLSGAPGGATQGISSSGLGLFGSGNFEGSDLQGPPSGAVDGLQYGITSAGDNPATGNTPVTGTNALIKNAVVFTLSGLPADFEYSKISNVSFQYGTSLSEPNVPVPEPATMVLLGSGLIGLAVFGRRRFFQ